MTLRRIDELQAEAVVGRFYLVPTVLYPWAGFRAESAEDGGRSDDRQMDMF